MSASTPLMVVALGGNAISPPRGEQSYAAERGAVGAAVAELAKAHAYGERLLIVHGNGPQVGRLLAAAGVGDADRLDVHVAQTQGELGYLIVDELERCRCAPAAALVTRARVDPGDPSFARPTKPVGPVLDAEPAGVASAPTPDGAGWRRVVASPRPHAVLEEAAIRELLKTHHVVAGGGGGVPVIGEPENRRPCAAVIDKDWVAALLAIALAADRLIYVTDVSHAFDAFGAGDQAPIHSMSVAAARRRLERGVFAPGSMQPKVESAIEFVTATGRNAVIATVGHLAAALAGRSGTTLRL
jgi:carbamate kinase